MKTSERSLLYRIFKRICSYNHFRDTENNYKVYDKLHSKGYTVNEDDSYWNIQRTNQSIYLRKNSSDYNVFNQILIQEEYYPIVDIIRTNNISIKNLMDIGANIGLTSFYLHDFFDSLKIICIEPDEHNFDVLNKNLSHIYNENLTTIKAALWYKQERLSSDNSFRDGKEWSLTFSAGEESNTDNIRGITFNELIIDLNLETIDILKIDIEGAERFIFDKKLNDLSFLNRTKIIALEIHDEFGIRDDIYKILLQYNFVLQNSGELTIGINKNCLDTRKHE